MLGGGGSKNNLNRQQLEGLISVPVEPPAPENWVSGDDVAYIIFTSGSTGAPKGVQITADCFDSFCSWALSIEPDAAPRENAIFLNQAPFSFDLSVYELAQSLASGSTLYCLTKQVQESPRLMLEALGSSAATIWVSTPSFAEVCLANDEFRQNLMPDLKLFLFCGEALRNTTALKLIERFPNAVVENTYGPTESTVAVTATCVTREMAEASEPLHCGIAKPGTRIAIAAQASSEPFSIEEADAGEIGEIVIIGDTVSKGYFGRDDLTARSFGSLEEDGRLQRAYRTGDEGFLDSEGNLHCRGRIDLQVKLNGFRIELGEIEESLARLPQVKEAAVVLVQREGAPYLRAFVVSEGSRAESDFREGQKIREALKVVLPHYMIPKKVSFLEAMPMTANGKINRKALA